MRRALLLLTLVGAILLACSGIVLAQTTNASTPSNQSDVVPGRYIVVLKESVPKARPEEKAKEAERDHGARVDHVYTEALRGYSAAIPDNKVEKVKNDPDVEYVAQDRKVQAFAQTLPKGIDRIDAEWNSATTGPDYGGSGMPGVAVLDTGVDSSHPDLNVARTSSGAVDGAACNGTSTNDGHGHGTHVSGTIAAKDDANGVVGVAPGAKVYPVKVLSDSGSGTTSTVVCGIDWVTANAAAKGIKVANMSLGGGGSDDGNCGNTNGDPEHRAICNSVNAGITYVVAAGNSNANLKDHVPASYNEVLTVTAIADYNGQSGGGAGATCNNYGPDDTPASFSNWTTSGSSDVSHTIAAPGVCINSTWKGGGYNTISGTSMASPHVAGSVVTCMANGACAGLTSPSQIIGKLRADAAAQPASYGYTYGGSNYYDKLEYAGGYRTSSSAPAAPTVDLADTSDTGRSSTDNVTSNDRPTFTGTAGGPHTVTIYDGNTAVCSTTATPDASGNYRYECAIGSTDPVLSNGAHSITAKATDSDGSTSSSSATLSVTIDTVAPTMPDGNLIPASGASGVALDARVSAIFDENEAMDSDTVTGSTFYLVDAANPTTTIPAAVAYDATAKKATLTPSAALTEGTTYTATVTTGAKDVAGNALAADKSWSFTTVQIAAPTSLQATRSGKGSSQIINLTWTDNSSKEDNFVVERSTDPNFATGVTSTSLPAGTQSYTDNNLSSRTTYFYRVKAINSAASSAYSNTVQVKTR